MKLVPAGDAWEYGIAYFITLKHKQQVQLEIFETPDRFEVKKSTTGRRIVFANELGRDGWLATMNWRPMPVDAWLAIRDRVAQLVDIGNMGFVLDSEMADVCRRVVKS
jgi:hypothetical protein